MPGGMKVMGGSGAPVPATAPRLVRHPCQTGTAPMTLTRRALVLAGVTSLAYPADAATRKAVSSAKVRYITADATGTGNGDSWANAASIWQLNDMIAAVGPGGTVYVRSDAGTYTITDT